MLAASKGTKQIYFFQSKTKNWPLVHWLASFHATWLNLSIFYIGKEQIVRELLDKKANKDVVNKDGLSAFMLAAKKGKTNILNLQKKALFLELSC